MDFLCLFDFLIRFALSLGCLYLKWLRRSCFMLETVYKSKTCRVGVLLCFVDAFFEPLASCLVVPTRCSDLIFQRLHAAEPILVGKMLGAFNLVSCCAFGKGIGILWQFVRGFLSSCHRHSHGFRGYDEGVLMQATWWWCIAMLPDDTRCYEMLRDASCVFMFLQPWGSDLLHLAESGHR